MLGEMSMLHVGLLYTERKLDKEKDKLDPHGATQTNATVKEIKESLIRKGHKVTLIPATISLLEDIKEKYDLDVIFNACTGVRHKREQANVVAMLELQDVPFVGSGLSTQILGLHKAISKRIWRAGNIPTPKFQVFFTGKEEIHKDLQYPLLVKPEREGSSLGIDHDSVVYNEEDLYRKIKQVIKTFKQPALAEEYLAGREFTVGIMGNGQLEVLPIIEIKYEHSDSNIMTVDIKAEDAVAQDLPAKLDNDVLEEIQDACMRAYTLLDCHDYARIDVRMDRMDKPQLIEINTLPGMQKGYSDFPKMAKAQGYEYEDLIEKLIRLAIERNNKDKSHD